MARVTKTTRRTTTNRRRACSTGSTSPRGTRRGACGGTPKRDGSGAGRGNRR